MFLGTNLLRPRAPSSSVDLEGRIPLPESQEVNDYWRIRITSCVEHEQHPLCIKRPIQNMARTSTRVCKPPPAARIKDVGWSKPPTVGLGYPAPDLEVLTWPCRGRAGHLTTCDSLRVACSRATASKHQLCMAGYAWHMSRVQTTLATIRAMPYSVWFIPFASSL